jgi:DUF1016 N-terminal domain
MHHVSTSLRSASRQLRTGRPVLGHRAAIREKQAVQDGGDAVVERLFSDLKRSFPGTTGFSAINLWRMRQMRETYTAPDFLSQLVREPGPHMKAAKDLPARPSAKQAQAVRGMVVAIPWGYHVNLLAKIEQPAQRPYYLQATARFGWSRNVLLNQIKAKAYERSLAEGRSHNFSLALPEHPGEQAEEALKSSDNLEFLGIRQQVKERELEDRLGYIQIRTLNGTGRLFEHPWKKNNRS